MYLSRGIDEIPSDTSAVGYSPYEWRQARSVPKKNLPVSGPLPRSEKATLVTAWRLLSHHSRGQGGGPPSSGEGYGKSQLEGIRRLKAGWAVRVVLSKFFLAN